jgi:hypothetical protein
MNTIEFHKTTTRELKAIQDRIRNLVPNWLEDGMYKETVLRGLIKNFLPKNFEAASGYVARQTGNRGTHQVSQQIDIIIYDTNYPILFKKEELVVVTADSVRGIIEVKSSDQSEKVKETLKKSNLKGQFIWEGKQDKTHPIFNGIFYYNLIRKSDNPLKTYLMADLQRESNIQPTNKFIVDHISYGENKFYKFWKNEITDDKRNFLYRTEDLSFSFFISNLISYLQPISVANNNFLWFPVDKSFNERIIWRF